MSAIEGIELVSLPFTTDVHTYNMNEVDEITFEQSELTCVHNFECNTEIGSSTISQYLNDSIVAVSNVEGSVERALQSGCDYSYGFDSEYM